MSRQTTKILTSVTLIIVVGLFGLMILSNFFGIFSSFLLIPVFFLLFISVFIIGLIVQYRERLHRREDMQRVAHGLGWGFTESTYLPLLTEFARSLGISTSNALKGKTENLINGLIQGNNVAVFDQTYTSGSGKNRTTHTQTLFLIEIKEAQFPVFCLTPESFVTRVFDFFERCDIDFPSHVYFSQKYQLYGPNNDHIRWFFTHQLLNFYEQNPLFTTVAGSRFILIYQHGRLFQPAEIMLQIDFLVNLTRLFLRR